MPGHVRKRAVCGTLPHMNRRILPALCKVKKNQTSARQKRLPIIPIWQALCVVLEIYTMVVPMARAGCVVSTRVYWTAIGWSQSTTTA